MAELPFTKNGYGTMVVMSIEQYSLLTDRVELALGQADNQAISTTKRMTAEEVFQSAKKAMHE